MQYINAGYLGDVGFPLISQVIAYIRRCLLARQYSSSYRVWTTDKPGIHVRPYTALYGLDHAETCSNNALTEIIVCNNQTQYYQLPGLRTCLVDTGDIGIVFSESYEKSSKGWFDGVSIAGEGYTCLKDTDTGKYCGEDIDGFTKVPTSEEIPENELNSFCLDEFPNLLRGAKPKSGTRWSKATPATRQVEAHIPPFSLLYTETLESISNCSLHLCRDLAMSPAVMLADMGNWAGR
ncbi:hypothetical protein CH63R_02028 [Colletotrichum higginsianum IMI 349063]|uniref:Uncharacterized protein n=1 Tax=Colletotrichum higginsianum (strain IMI 349063) TaxID=759273 RepID=A0A1B7YMY2_COLHI|nr:hypothetical protein CH63R_02028 [Colletotrichum higginsianum IMI 349063]OBR13302.1 hypothetical protein CH63R_02028 [Colletotrichum higginsianum IMI 349063]